MNHTNRKKCCRDSCPRECQPGRSKCEQCTTHERERSAKRYHDRKAAGLCTFPGCNISPQGKVRCPEHVIYFSKAKAKYRRKKKQKEINQ